MIGLDTPPPSQYSVVWSWGVLDLYLFHELPPTENIQYLFFLRFTKAQILTYLLAQFVNKISTQQYI